MVSLMMPSVSLDTDTSANDITSPCYFQCHWHNVMPKLVPMASHEQNVMSHLIVTYKCNGASDNSIGTPRICLDIV